MGFDLLHSKAYQELNYGPALKTLNWIYEKVQFRVNRRRCGKGRYEIMNEGKISFTYNEAELRSLDHRKFSRALKELVACGFIDIKKHGSGLMGDYSVFILSDRWRYFGTSKFERVELSSGTKYGFQNRRQRQKTGVSQRQNTDVGNGIFSQSPTSKN